MPRLRFAHYLTHREETKMSKDIDKIDNEDKKTTEKQKRVGFCFTGSFCTLANALDAMAELVRRGYDIVPIMSENAFYTDTRFSSAEDFSRKVEAISGRKIIHTVVDAEPLGPTVPLDALVVAPCTGNTLAKAALGITDTAATMAIKAHLRRDRPTLIALCSNDAMSQNLGNIGTMLKRKSVYFLPMCQDSPKGKPHSLVADMSRLPEALEAMWQGEQLRPVFT